MQFSQSQLQNQLLPSSVFGLSRRSTSKSPMIPSTGFQAPQRNNTQTLKQIIQSVPPKEENKILWGSSTWFVLHTLSEKVSDLLFQEIREELLNILYTICVNLPCPTCTEHAKQYLNGINFHSIQTKQQLQRMMFDFHNSVNERKKISLFPYSEVQNQYSKAITKNILQNFMYHYEQRSKSVRLLADELHRQSIVKILKEWFNNHIQYFSP